jgi:hypothetical protein
MTIENGLHVLAPNGNVNEERAWMQFTILAEFDKGMTPAELELHTKIHAKVLGEPTDWNGDHLAFLRTNLMYAGLIMRPRAGQWKDMWRVTAYGKKCYAGGRKAFHEAYQSVKSLGVKL